MGKMARMAILALKHHWRRKGIPDGIILDHVSEIMMSPTIERLISSTNM
jgi:hypothetical protein